MRKKFAEQHRKAAYEALHGQPPPAQAANNSTVDRNVMVGSNNRDKMDSMNTCRNCFLFVALVRVDKEEEGGFLQLTGL